MIIWNRTENQMEKKTIKIMLIRKSSISKTIISKRLIENYLLLLFHKN